MTTGADAARIVVRSIRPGEIEAADRIFRLAFGTYLGLPDPSRFVGDGDMIRTRTRSDAVDTIVAEIDGEVVGSNVVTSWGSVGFFGPLTVKLDLWDKGIARALMACTLEIFDRRGVRVLAEVRDLCDSVFAGFDPTSEVRSVSEQQLGDTVIVRDPRTAEATIDPTRSSSRIGAETRRAHSHCVERVPFG